MKSGIFRMMTPLLLWLIYVYNSVIQTLWFLNLPSIQAHRLAPVNPALSMVEVTVLLQSKSADKLAVNHSTEETIPASGDSGWSLSIFHCKINSYAKVCLFYKAHTENTYKIVITMQNIFKCHITFKYTEYSNIPPTTTHTRHYIHTTSHL